MQFLCISAANVLSHRDSSGSTMACELVARMLQERCSTAEVEIVRLVDHDMKPCIMCAACALDNTCRLDTGFNSVYQQMLQADAIVVVAPHYAPIPSKLMILLEKLQELCYLALCRDRQPGGLRGKPIALIAHGGQPTTAEVDTAYREALLDPLAGSFAACQMRVVSAGENQESGVTFGISAMPTRPGQLLPDMVHDWEDVRRRLSPLLDRLLATMA